MIFHIYRIPSHIYIYIYIYIYICTYIYIYLHIYVHIYTLNSRMKDPWVNELPAMLGVRFLQTPAPPAAPPARALPAEDHGIDLECSGWIFLYNYIYIYSIIFLYIFLYNSYSGLNVKWFKCQQSNWRRFRKHCREPPKQGRLWKGMCHALSLLNQ